MNISINPTYFCNFRCDFCYLSARQLSDRTRLDLDVLHRRLSEISSYQKIDSVDLYGGEIGILPKEYLYEIKSLLGGFGLQSANIITNLSVINPAFIDPFFDISVSYDFDCREKHALVWRNMCELPREFSILMLAGKCLIRKCPDEMIQFLNTLNNLVSVEIKPYSQNQANSHPVEFSDFEDFVKKWIISKEEKRFTFVNELLLQDVLSRSRNSFSDDHVYITPNGRFGVLDFDLNDREYFQEYDSFEQYLDWCVREKTRVHKNNFCNSCEYLGRCLSEHLRDVQDTTHSCNGFKNLIEWYKKDYSYNPSLNVNKKLIV
jgi:MoaA/NifB/PqqE/SkfB family radical SAM enzyme